MLSKAQLPGVQNPDRLVQTGLRIIALIIALIMTLFIYFLIKALTIALNVSLIITSYSRNYIPNPIHEITELYRLLFGP